MFLVNADTFISLSIFIIEVISDSDFNFLSLDSTSITTVFLESIF